MHSPRPIDVQYRVGQVIKHKLFNYRAVIIGWDERPKAPKGWFQGAVPESEMATYVNQPFYSVLIDTRDRAPQTTYVPSFNIVLLPHNRVSRTKNWISFKGMVSQVIRWIYLQPTFEFSRLAFRLSLDVFICQTSLSMLLFACLFLKPKGKYSLLYLERCRIQVWAVVFKRPCTSWHWIVYLSWKFK